MYEQHFRLFSKPFAMNPDPGFLYVSPQHASALTMLEYAIESQAPFCVLTGEVGSGKTTLLRHLLRGLADEITVGLISNTHTQFRSIYPWALSALGVACNSTDVAQYDALLEFFLREYSKRRRTLLVLDEAHNLTPPILEELRLLSNVNSQRDLLLQVMLVGQPELRGTLELPELRQFAQRVSVDYHLGPLDKEDVQAYIRHRLQVVGGDPAMFAPEAITFIFARTGGVPRLINQLCDMALVYAFAERLHRINLDLLQQVLKDRKGWGAIPLFAGRSTKPRVPGVLGTEHG